MNSFFGLLFFKSLWKDKNLTINIINDGIKAYKEANGNNAPHPTIASIIYKEADKQGFPRPAPKTRKKKIVLTEEELRAERIALAKQNRVW